MGILELLFGPKTPAEALVVGGTASVRINGLS
jgi:hypothetical protein